VNIQYYGYNCFVLSFGGKKIAIDPGGLFLYYFQMTTLIPEDQWGSLTHILVTHGDPDHYWHLDEVAAASGASVICNKMMSKDGKLLGPRSKGLTFDCEVENVHLLDIGQRIEVDDLKVTGFKTTHGSLTFSFGPFSKTVTPGPDERVGWGAIGFVVEIAGIKIVILGDALLETEAWQAATNADVLFIPIGGEEVGNTMGVDEAIEAVSYLMPKLVIPCHYNCKAFFTEYYSPDYDKRFKSEVEKLGSTCKIMQVGDTLVKNFNRTKQCQGLNL